MAVRDAATEAMSVLGLPPAWRQAGVAAAYAICVWTLLEGLLLPLRFFQGCVLERRYALSRVAAATWLSGHLKTVALGAVAVMGAAVVVSLSRSIWPVWWWVASGGVFAATTIGLSNLAPIWIIPRLHRVRPVTRTRLTRRLATLAERAGVAAPRIDECTVGVATRRAYATLVGMGPLRRILLSDTLLANYSDDEIEAVLAHELGHHVHRDVWQVLAFELCVAMMALWAGGWTVSSLGGRFGVVGAGDVAGLPLLALGVGVVAFAAAPIGHALSRCHERRADRFAIRMTRNPAAFMTSLRRLGEQNLVEERPSRLVEVLCHTHPPLYRRLADARLAEAAHQP